MKTRFSIFGHATVLPILLAGCSQYPMNGPGRGWGHMMGYGGFGGIFVWLILILIAGAIIYFIVNGSKGTKNSADSTRETPIEILKRRYAGGEISKEEFDRLKRDIET
jgi:putative membrane protein